MSNSYEIRENKACDRAQQHNGNIYGNVTYNHAPRTDAAKELALLEAAQYGQLDRVDRLLRTDINVDFLDSEGRSALHWAAVKNHPSIVQRLLDADCDFDISSPTHGTALCQAARQGADDVVEILLAAGAHVNAPGGWHGSVLHAACMSGHVAIVEMLLKANAQIDALHVVVERYLEGNRWLYMHTCCNPLFMAACDAAILLVLAKNGAYVDATAQQWASTAPSTSRKDGPSRAQWEGAATHKAAPSEYPAALQALVNADASLESRTTHNRSTPLMLAAESGRLENLSILIRHGAAVNGPGDTIWNNELDSGSMALAKAQSNKHKDCVDLLIRAGAVSLEQHVKGSLRQKISKRLGYN